MVDVSVASDLVTEGILVVGSGLSGVGVTVSGLAELILRTVLAGGVSVSVVRGSGNNGSRGNHGGGNGGGVGSSNGGGVGSSNGGGVGSSNGSGVSSAGGDGESVVAVTVVSVTVVAERIVESVSVEGILSLGNSRQHQ